MASKGLILSSSLATTALFFVHSSRDLHCRASRKPRIFKDCRRGQPCSPHSNLVVFAFESPVMNRERQCERQRDSSAQEMEKEVLPDPARDREPRQCQAQKKLMPQGTAIRPESRRAPTPRARSPDLSAQCLALLDPSPLVAAPQVSDARFSTRLLGGSGNPRKRVSIWKVQAS